MGVAGAMDLVSFYMMLPQTVPSRSEHQAGLWVMRRMLHFRESVRDTLVLDLMSLETLVQQQQVGRVVPVSEQVLYYRGDGNGLGAGNPTGSNYEFLNNVQTSNAAQMAALNAGSVFLIGGNVNGRTLGSEGLGITNTGYRKTQIELKPNGLGTGFIINVWITEGSPSGGIVHQLVKDLAYAGTSVPANLSYGFAGSTGGSTNFHEIRNLDIKVPGSFIIPAMMAIKENIFEGVTNKFNTNLSNDDNSKELSATNLISPNGDGKNDTWVIRNIEKYPNNIVRVFDRLGRSVYSVSNYNNSWDGIYQGALLPEDTYYYIIELQNGEGKKRGYISIIR
jgi:gliding motility-associated-like protein